MTPRGAGVNVAVFSAHATAIEFCLFDARRTRDCGACACRSAPATCSTAMSPRCRPARAMACARTARIGRARAIASTRPSCWSIRTRAPSTGRSRCIRRCSATLRQQAIGPPRRQRQRAVRAQRRSFSARRRRRRGRPIACRGPTRSSTNCMCAASPGAIRTFPRRCAARFAGLAHPGGDRASGPARRHHGRDHAGRRLDRRAPSRRARPDQLLGLQPDRLDGAGSTTGARRLGRDPRRRRRAARGRASRSSSTSCSTIPARATRSARRCRCAASTTRPTTGSMPATRRAMSTTPAAAIRWRSIARRRCAWRWMRCAPGRSWAASHGFRFDLATMLGRRADGFDPAAPLLSAIAQDPCCAT